MNFKCPVNPEQDINTSESDSFMVKAFNNKKFNSYQTGPGSALDEARNNCNKLILCIKDAPKYLNEISIQRILSNYGDVISVHKPRAETCTYYFAECFTENDFEAILKGMKVNELNMRVEPKTVKKTQIDKTTQIDKISQIERTIQTEPERIIDMTNRKIKGPFSKRQHPKLGRENNNTNNQEYGFYYKNLHLQANLPLTDNDYNIIKEKDLRMNMINKKAESSDGMYDSTKGTYIKTCKDISSSQLKFPPCRNCNKISNKKCENCNVYYCSIDCQNQYMKIHQYCCSNFAVFANKSITPSPITNKPVKDDIPKSGQTVIVTHVEQTNMVFVRSYAKNDDYVEVINEIERYSQKAKILQKIPKVDEYVVANYNGIWCRGIVLNNENSDQIHIAYIDFGNCEKKKLSELKEMLPECYNLKYYPFVIFLKNLEKCISNDDFINYMNKIVKYDVQLKILYKENDIMDNKIVAELLNLETNENINNKCMQLLTPSIPKDTDEPTFFEISQNLDETNLTQIKQIKIEELPVGENISIIITSHSKLEFGTISCIPSCAALELDDLNDYIKKYAELNDYCYTPRFNEMCIAKSENEAWYRACCVEIVGDGYPCLLFIDYGNVSPVSIRNIRKYPKAFTLPCKTDECDISGLNHLMETQSNAELGTRLRQLLPLYKEITVTKIERINNHNTIHLPHIIGTLRREGLLEN